MFKKKIVIVVLFTIFILVNQLYAFQSMIVVNNPMNFGKVQYGSSPAYFTIGSNNLLQGANTSHTYNTGAKLATITIYGQPRETVSLTFSATKLTGDMGSVDINGIEVINGNNNIQLNNSGRATVYITATLSILSNDIQGIFNGNITVWANYQNQKTNLSQKIPITAEIFTPKIGHIKDLEFGIIYMPSPTCHVTVTLNNTEVTNCPNTDGNVQVASFQVSSISNLSLSSISLPTTVTLQGPGGKTLTVNGFTSGIAAVGINSYTVTVGATLNIPTNTKPGKYSGTYQVMINY